MRDACKFPPGRNAHSCKFPPDTKLTLVSFTPAVNWHCAAEWRPEASLLDNRRPTHGTSAVCNPLWILKPIRLARGAVEAYDSNRSVMFGGARLSYEFDAVAESAMADLNNAYVGRELGATICT